MSRQISVVYASLIREISENVPEIDKIVSADKPGRRVGPAQYRGDDLVELYLAFSSRKTNIDTKERLSEEFSRLDFVENLSDIDFQDQYYSTLSMLSKLDSAFARYESDEKERFAKGRDIFDGQPARIGFVVAIAMNVLGRPGSPDKPAERKKNMLEVSTKAEKLVRRLNKLSDEDLKDFLRLDVLREVLDIRVGQVGRYERAVFYEAFKVLVDEGFEVPNMEPCWRAN